MGERAQVSIVRTRDRAVGVPTAIDRLHSAAASFAGRNVVIKPNFNSDDPFPGSTHPDTLRALVSWLRRAGADEMTLAERSGGSWITREVFDKKGIPSLAGELGIEAVATDGLPPEEWLSVPLPGSHWARGVEVPRLILEAEAVVQTCCLKTHAFGGHFTLSLKNVVGVIAKTSPHDGYEFMKELHGSDRMREMIAEANAVYRPDLILLDGIDAFVRGGPARGDLVHPGVLLASTDRIAIDAVGVAILRMYDTTPEILDGPIFELDQIRRGAELGLGVDAPDRIELVPSKDPESQRLAEEIRRTLLA